MSATGELLTCRRILAIVLFVGLIFQYMLRINITIAIVDMIAKNSTNTTHRFPWTETQRQQVLGAFFWGYILTTLIGGRLAEIYGSRIVNGTAILLASVLTLLTPTAAYLNYHCLVAVRAVQGLCLGVTIPSIPPIAARWIPPEDRAKFMSHLGAAALGTALGMPLCGFLIVYLGWPSVFYVTGFLALIWSIAWFYLVYDSPRQHPRISKEEREELDEKLGNVVATKQKTPWLQILTSLPVWAIIVANSSAVFTCLLVTFQLPTYMDQVLHYRIQENGLLSSLPHIVGYGSAVFSAIIADKIGKRNTLTTLTIRKLFVLVLFVGSSLVFLVQALWGYSRVVSLMVFTVSFLFYGFLPASLYTNCLDLSPIYSGTILGLANAFGSIAGYISTQVVAVITETKQDFAQWQIIFWIIIAINCVGLVVYLIFASADLQSWHPSNLQIRTDHTELQKLKDKTPLD